MRPKPSPREQLVCRIRAMREAGRSWRKIGEALDVPHGTLHFIYTRPYYEPRRPSIRRKLGLPLLALAPVCPKCYGVHVTTRCVQRKRKLSFEENCAAYDQWMAAKQD